MEDRYFETMAIQALHEWDRISHEQLKRQVILAMKEVERDTRHRAAELAMEHHSEIMNMRHK